MKVSSRLKTQVVNKYKDRLLRNILNTVHIYRKCDQEIGWSTTNIELLQVSIWSHCWNIPSPLWGINILLWIMVNMNLSILLCIENITALLQFWVRKPISWSNYENNKPKRMIINFANFLYILCIDFWSSNNEFSLC